MRSTRSRRCARRRRSNDPATCRRRSRRSCRRPRRSPRSSAPGSTASSPAWSRSIPRASRRCRAIRRRRCCPGCRREACRGRRRHALARPDHADCRAHEAGRRPQSLRMRLMAAMAQQDCGQCGYDCKNYSKAIFDQQGGAAEPLRAGRQGNRPHGEGAVRGDRQGRRRRRQRLLRPCLRPPRPTRRSAVRATIRPWRRSCRARCSTRPGSEKETWHVEIDLAACGLDYVVGDAFGLFPANDPALVDAVIKALGAPGDFPIGGRTLREVLTDGVSLSPAPDMLFQLHLLHHRRRPAEKGEGAGVRRGSGWRCGNARRAGGAGEIPRRAARSGSLHRGARSVAAAALFDLVVVQGESRAGRADGRYRALRHRRARPARRRLDLPRRARRARRRRSRFMCSARTPSACRPIRTCRSS